MLDNLHKQDSSDTKEMELGHKLLELGLLQEITPPIKDFTPYQNRKPAELKTQSKTASEIIIEERQ